MIYLIAPTVLLDVQIASPLHHNTGKFIILRLSKDSKAMHNNNETIDIYLPMMSISHP